MFFSNKFGYLLRTFVYHYKNCCGKLKLANVATGIRVHCIWRVVLGGSHCVPRVSRSCSSRRICFACRLCMCPWEPSCRSARIWCPIVHQDLGLAAMMLSRAEPHMIQAVLWCETNSRRQWSISRCCTQPLGQRAQPRVFFVELAIAPVGARRPGSSRRRTPSRKQRVSRCQAFVDGKPGVYLVPGAGVGGRGWTFPTSQHST